MMEGRLMVIGAGALVLLLGATAGVFTIGLEAGAAAQLGVRPRPGESTEQLREMAAGKAKVNFGAVPVPVQTTIRTLATPDNVKKILVEVDGGVTMFQARFTVDGADTSAMIAPSGEILEIKRTTDQSVLPRMAMEALKERYKDATLLNTASVQRFYYEVNVVVDGRVHEVRVDPSGRLHDVDRTEKDAD